MRKNAKLPKVLGKRIQKRRKELGLTQEQLAARMGTTASAVSRIESGQHKTSRETLRKLALALQGRAIIGFDFSTPRHKRRQLILL